MDFKKVNEQILGEAFSGLLAYEGSDWFGKAGTPAAVVQKCNDAYFFNLVHAKHTIVEVRIHNPREPQTWSGHMVKIINKENGEICRQFFGFNEFMPGAPINQLYWCTNSCAAEGGEWYGFGEQAEPTEHQILAYRKALRNFISLFQTSADFRHPKERGVC